MRHALHTAAPPQCGSLTSLRLCSNALEALPASLCALPRLRLLDLSDNPSLLHLPYGFERLSALRMLGLKGLALHSCVRRRRPTRGSGRGGDAATPRVCVRTPRRHSPSSPIPRSLLRVAPRSASERGSGVVDAAQDTVLLSPALRALRCDKPLLSTLREDVQRHITSAGGGALAVLME